MESTFSPSSPPHSVRASLQASGRRHSSVVSPCQWRWPHPRLGARRSPAPRGGGGGGGVLPAARCWCSRPGLRARPPAHALWSRASGTAAAHAECSAGRRAAGGGGGPSEPQAWARRPGRGSPCRCSTTKPQSSWSPRARRWGCSTGCCSSPSCCTCSCESSGTFWKPGAWGGEGVETGALGRRPSWALGCKVGKVKREHYVLRNVGGATGYLGLKLFVESPFLLPRLERPVLQSWPGGRDARTLGSAAPRGLPGLWPDSWPGHPAGYL